MKKFFSYICLLLCTFLNLTLHALNISDSVPNFEAIDANGKTWSLNKFHLKKYVLLYFYPAAMTGGCTKQACSYRDSYQDWQKLGVEVVGISGDLPENLSLFTKAEKLPFTLLSDPDGKVAQLFRVPQKKGGIIERFFLGDKYTLERGVTIKRWTFLISKSGKLIYKNDKVDPLKDSENIMNFIKNENQ